MSDLDLLLDEENEISFQLNIEGTQPGTAKCRLAIDGDHGMGLIFESDKVSNDEVTFTLPALKHVLKEGTRDLRLEVIVDDKFFEPLTLKGNFEKRVSVTAEAVVRKPKTKGPVVKAAPVVKTKPRKKETVAEAVVKKLENKNATVKNESKRPRRKVSDKEILDIISKIAAKNS